MAREYFYLTPGVGAGILAQMKYMKKLTVPVLLVLLLLSCNREELVPPIQELIFEVEIDGYVDDSSASDFSTGVLTVNGEPVIPPQSKAMLTFDMGNIPPGVTIISAVLKLKCVVAPVEVETVSVRRIMKSWEEGTIDFTTASEASFTDEVESPPSRTLSQTNEGTTISFTIESIVAEWAKGRPNYGLVLAIESVAPVGPIKFATSEGDQIPELEIWFR